MIKVDHLTKVYGEVCAVDDLSFEIEAGKVYGFLGPNGAGKTTTMNIMTGCLSATAGRVTIDGHDIFEDADQAKRLIGYLPEQPPLYMNDTPLEYLRFVGAAKGLSGLALATQIEDVMATVRIDDVAGRRIADLSKGYRQRVGIAQALLGKPQVIILDEPTVGLDPLQIIEIRDLIQSLGRDHTVILSSHILSEVQAICEEILIIAHGRLVAFDTPAALDAQFASAGEIVLTTDAPKASAERLLSTLDGVAALHGEKRGPLMRFVLSCKEDDLYAISRQVFFAFAERRWALLEMRLDKASLEDIFIELTENTEVKNDVRHFQA